jgi:hypothetical protein
MGENKAGVVAKSAFPPLGVAAARFGREIWRMGQFRAEALAAFEKSAELNSGIVAAIGAALRDEPRLARPDVDEDDLIDIQLERGEAEAILEQTEMFRANSAEHFPRMLSEMCLVTLFARYDAFVSELLACVFRLRPELLKSGKKVTFENVLEAGSLDELKDELIDREVQDWRLPMRKQLDLIKKRFGVEIDLPERDILALVDASERRNVIVHRGGRMDSRYLREVPDSSAVGMFLEIDSVYVEETSAALTRLVFKIATEVSEHCLGESFELTDDLFEATS